MGNSSGSGFSIERIKRRQHRASGFLLVHVPKRSLLKPSIAVVDVLMGTSLGWSQSITVNATDFPAAVARDVIVKLSSELNARGVAVPLISDQGFWNLSGCINYIDDVVGLETEQLYGSFSCHDYKNQGFPYWMTVESKAAELLAHLKKWRKDTDAPVPTELNPKYNPDAAAGGKKKGKNK
jgi:hypothetical protein